MTPPRCTPGQLRCLQGLAFGALSMNDVAKASFVALIVPGKTSFHELTTAEAARVIDAMKLKAGQTPTRPAPRERRRVHASDDVLTLATPAQRELLAQLGQRVGEAGFGAPYVRGVFQRACGCEAPRTSSEAEKAIEALKALLERPRNGQPEPA